MAYAVLAVGIGMRVVALFTGRVASDGASYAVMADSLWVHGEFIMPLGESWSDSWTPEYSHHYSPAYPVFLLPFVVLGGLNPWSVKLASLLSGFLLIAGVHRTTRDLYGQEKGLLVAAAVAVDPMLVLATGTGYSENFLTLFFVLTIWAILRSLKDPRYMVLAGFFAGVAYLTKGVMGWFFLIAGLAGLAWRFHYVRWRVFRDRHYVVAILIFGSFVVGWATRNLVRFWDGSASDVLTAWQSSAYFAITSAEAVSRPGDLAFVLLARIPLYVLFFLFFGAFWVRDLRRMPKMSDEHYSGLWLAIGLTYVLAWIISGILWTSERQPIFWLDMMRYVVMANPVILWLLVKDANVESVVFRRKYVATVAVLLAASLIVVVPATPGVYQAYDILQANAPEGSVVAVDGLLRYSLLIGAGSGLIYVKYVPGVAADFIITSDIVKTFPGYTLLGIGRTTVVVPGFVPADDAAVWRRG